MPSFCAVLDCIDKYGHGRAVPFHKFPTKNKELLEKWIYFTQRPKDWRPSRWTSVCGLHFRDEDYRCLEQKKLLKKTAVPSVRATKNNASVMKTKESSKKENYDYSIDMMAEKEPDNCEPEDTVKTHDKPNLKCRFCGCGTTNYDSFAGNFEIYGVIQKCLPTLSILQDDDMPKEICAKCLNHMRGFACFIDKVLETQATLLRQFRQEKGSAKPMERVLKIKQEPVVRVKQENFEDVNALFPDEVDDGGEQENDASNTESQLDQKIQFCDFPVLNDQDLINNCDIMEIINLSDPFIDITNCENTLADEEQQQQQQQDIPTIASRVSSKNMLQSAHELLQSHMLIEEHNYAYAAEDFKEEWQIKNCYKTEKIEAEEFDDQADQTSFNCNFVENEQLNNCLIGSFIDEEHAADVAAITTIETSMERSIKPIVTSVSSFKENTITTYPPSTSFAAAADQQQPVNQPNTTSRKRPNIVVLNESIVQSSHTFQLQACTICQSKFIGVDSLNQHYATTHAMGPPAAPLPQTITPMVTVPTANITATTWQNNIPQKNLNLPAESCKVEKDATFDFNNQRSCNQNYTKSAESVTVTANIDVSNKRSSKNEIKILDMQQSFLHEYNYPNLIRFDQQSNMNFNASQINAISAFPLQTQTHTFPAVAPANAVITAQKNLPEDPTSTPDVLTAKYMALQKSYDRLRLKCERLVCKTRSKKISKRKSRFNCRICSTKFSTICQLLRHRQTAPFHEPLKRPVNFFASCPGCEKFFCHKIALFNHMRYICQALPLSWFKSQLRTFKCRCCRLITFTHWRLYRKHEIKCRLNRKLKLKESQNLASNTRIKPAANRKAVQSQKINNQNTKARDQPKLSAVQSVRTSSQAAPYTCAVCQKVFPSSSSLNQHSITHSNLRSFECEICKRIFKRRNGLTQHVKGFHLKLKPFECPVCLRSYSLKGDVKRCKHSLMNRSKLKV